MGSDEGVRVGDAERERASSELGDHFAAGRLTRDELDDRLERTWNAKTVADLAPLFTDLPRSGVVAEPKRERPAVARPGYNGPRLELPPPLLLLVAIVLTVTTHVPFIAFFIAWFAMTRVFGGFHRRQQLIGR